MGSVTDFESALADNEIKTLVEEYGNLSQAGLDLAAAVVQTRRTFWKAVAVLQERYGDGGPLPIADLLGRAARHGDSDAKFIKDTGFLGLSDRALISKPSTALLDVNDRPK